MAKYTNLFRSHNSKSVRLVHIILRIILGRNLLGCGRLSGLRVNTCFNDNRHNIHKIVPS